MLAVYAEVVEQHAEDMKKERRMDMEEVGKGMDMDILEEGHR